MRALLGWILLPGWMTRRPRQLGIESTTDLEPAKFKNKWSPKTGERVEIIFGGTLVLRKQHQLGKMSKGRVHKALKIKAGALEKSGGVKLLQAYDQGQAQGSYEQALVRHSDFEKSKRILNAVGATLVAANVKISGKKYILYKDHSQVASAWAWWSIALVPCILMATWNWNASNGLVKELRLSLNEASIAITETQNRLDSFVVTRESALQQDAAVEALQADFLTGTIAPGLLLDLTETLPNIVWLSAFRLERNEILLRGSTLGDVTDVIDQLRELSWVKSVALVSPVVRDRARETEAFELSVGVGGR